MVIRLTGFSVLVLTCLLALLRPSLAFDNRYLIKDAESGDMEAQYTLGHLYLKGRGGLERDHQSGVGWLVKAAEAGHRDAPFDLAMFYLEAEDRDRRKKAYYWLNLAAEMDHMEAQYVLGLAYQSSDPERGLQWLERAARSGHEDAAKKIDDWCRRRVVMCD